MYVTKLEVRNIRSIGSFEFDLSNRDPSGWHVILGDNGAGKSSFVRSLALALAGPREGNALRQNWADWLKYGSNEGSIAAHIEWNPELDAITGSGKRPIDGLISEIVIRTSSEALSAGAEISTGKRSSRGLDRALWGKGVGWFSASFGPYRRFKGGNPEHSRIFLTNPRLAPHLSAFGEDVALTECLEWIKALHIRRLEGEDDSGFLECLTEFLNKGDLLPHGTQLSQITSEEIRFRDGNDSVVRVDQLSDGYRSILSLTFELIRLLTISYGEDRVVRHIRSGEMLIDLPGVVAIDEVDAHLHPTWQRRIGPWFTRLFPKLQFLVTTHSPIICQAAEEGSVWRLPTPGSTDTGGRIEGDALRRLVYGNLLEAYDTQFFGENVTRSDSSRTRLAELARLNRDALLGKLTPKTSARLEQLRASMPSTASVADRVNLEIE